MGKKIPGRKHRGIRDPEKQRIERLKDLKHKINAPPTHPDEQHVPKSLTRLIELKNKFKTGTVNKRVKKEKKKHMFERLPGEKDKQFLFRINQACRDVQKETAFEVKYGVKILKNKNTGEVEEIVKRPKDELELHVEKLKAEKRGKKKKKVIKDEEKLSKSQKKQRKLKERKLKKTMHRQEKFELSRDDVKFGETVHAPPSLSMPRKVEKNLCAPRPGKKQLLLKDLLANNKSEVKENKQTSSESSAAKKQAGNKIINKKGKRKDLPHALRRQLDKQQQEVIQAYKNMKLKKYNTT